MSSAGSSARELREFRRPVRKVFLRPDGTFKPWESKIEKGMTTLGFVLKEGIVIAADRPSDTQPNIFQLNHCMVATISGGGKDRGRDTSSFTPLIKSLQYQAKHVTSVHDLLAWLATTISAKKEYSSVGILIAVWNESERGLYKVNGDGVITENDILATGSGSPATILVKMERRCIESGMSIPDAADLAKMAICIAANDAPHYGDVVSVCHLGSEGFQMLFEEDMEEFHSSMCRMPRTQDNDISGKAEDFTLVHKLRKLSLKFPTLEDGSNSWEVIIRDTEKTFESDNRWKIRKNLHIK
ncbi:Proteasome subunit beta type-5-B [Striga hermonthica]|uniref:Proteasome subunit beta type-5-B n=1 Tax=Striga hermonthica TaxID=68872 RepID=A0A9N7N9J2_STRHE|nr:Proteasome subunit beta type-5-B [Striga hermonthica]